MYWLVLLAVPWIVVAVRPGVPASRRLLAVMLVVVVPIAGPILALLVRRVRGGQVPLEPVRSLPRHRPSPADVTRLGDLPPVLERLMTGGAAERLAALVHLSSVGDAAAVAVLRWAVEHGGPEVVLEAALTLEELDLRQVAVVAPVITVARPTPVADAAWPVTEPRVAARVAATPSVGRDLAVGDLPARGLAMRELATRDLAVV